MVSLKPISSIRDIPVLDLETGEVLGRVTSWAINPTDQRIAAWLLNKPSLFGTQLAISPADIIEYSPDMIVVRDRTAVINPKEILGLTDLIQRKLIVIGLPAISETRKPLGQVTELLFDTISSKIEKYYLSPGSGLTRLTSQDLVIPADKVVEITGRQVVFADMVDQTRPERVEPQPTTTPYKV